MLSRMTKISDHAEPWIPAYIFFLDKNLKGVLRTWYQNAKHKILSTGGCGHSFSSVQ